MAVTGQMGTDQMETDKMGTSQKVTGPKVTGQKVPGPTLTCRIGTVRLPGPVPIDPGQLARTVEAELGHLIRLAPPPVPPGRTVVAWPHQMVTAPPSTSAAGLARLIAGHIHRQLQTGGMP